MTPPVPSAEEAPSPSVHQSVLTHEHAGGFAGISIRGNRMLVNALRASLSLMPALIAGTMLVVAWELFVRVRDVPRYLLPSPSSVIDRLVGSPAVFLSAGAVTALEAAGGLVLGSLVAVAAAALMAHSRFLERSLLPIAVLIKVTPIVTIAPLFVIWFGFGIAPKIVISALIAFFPMLVNSITGFRSVHPGALDMLESLHASKVDVFLKLRFQSALPYIFAALKSSTTLCVIGAVVGEWIGADKGLGRMIALSYANLDIATLFAAIICLAIIGILLMSLVALIERRVLFWHESNQAP